MNYSKKPFIFSFFLFILAAFLCPCWWACVEKAPPTAQHADLVDLAKLDSTIVLDIRYATTNNFVGEQLYPVAKCLLRPKTAARLLRVQNALQAQGFGLKVWDAYRPLSVQWRLWERVPNPDYVADPRKGSRHNRGGAVDVTLVDLAGSEVLMPTGYDDFSERAHRDFMDAPAEVLRHRQLLEDAMVKEGFLPLPTEWWHFDDPEWETFELLDVPLDRFKLTQ